MRMSYGFITVQSKKTGFTYANIIDAYIMKNEENL